MIKQIIKSAFPVASSLISGIFGNKQQSQYLAQQERANNIAFQKNKELAQYQNQLNIDSWNMQNQYNSPRAQMARLREAGINPDLYYGGGTSGLTASNSPSMSGGTPISPADYTLGGRRRTFGDIFQQTMDVAMQQAQIRNLNSNTTGQNIDNETKGLMNVTMVNKLLSEIGLNEETRNKIIAEIPAINLSVDKITAEISAIRSSIVNDTERVALEKIRVGIEKSLSEQNIAESKSRINLNDAQRKSILDKLSQEIYNLTKQGELTQSQINEQTARTVITILEQEKVIAETDKIILENMIMKPQAISNQYVADSISNFKIGDYEAGKDLYASFQLVMQFLGACGGISSFIPK